MPANDNAHALRMISTLREIRGVSATDAFAQSFPLSKSADVTRKHQWAYNVCAALESQFGAEDAANIRHACRCGDGATMAKEIAACITRADCSVPRLWCECSAGYAEAMFRQLFGDTVCVTLLGTAKSGDSRCTFSITW